MKLNQELVKRLAAGEIQLQNTGTVSQIISIITAAAPSDESIPSGMSKYYKVLKYGHWLDQDIPFPNLPIYTTEQFFEAETHHVPDVRKTMDYETRELAKQLFNDYMIEVRKMSYNSIEEVQSVKLSAMKTAIKDAKQFIKLLNNHE